MQREADLLSAEWDTGNTNRPAVLFQQSFKHQLTLTMSHHVHWRQRLPGHMSHACQSNDHSYERCDERKSALGFLWHTAAGIKLSNQLVISGDQLLRNQTPRSCLIHWTVRASLCVPAGLSVCWQPYAACLFPALSSLRTGYLLLSPTLQWTSDRVQICPVCRTVTLFWSALQNGIKSPQSTAMIIICTLNQWI